MEAVKVGKHFFNAHPTAVSQVFSAADNKDGVYLRTATLCTGGGILNLYTGPKAPAYLGDMSVHAIMGGINGGIDSQYTLPYQLFIPAGYGLWTVANNATAAVALTYDFVS
ncbi:MULTISPECIES: hypothetical protein [Pseudomonas]|jgi:hypothetical protein|uniref:Uncharacterized protein n=3 Tax=Pseudomonas TaxID=286 RepID=A0AA42S2V8_9PSED|nr:MULTISPECIES: hypothetical protein [Pseudomonas]MBI6898515.1 hypothetical protein [Pseudomonas putida]KNX79236.1 hypothetical protein DA83_17440 [Pseudomonas sp. 250J]MBC3437368.1 hypothetical protein [Pseudomonas sp. BW16M2]MBV4505018.1 hypothetical protein [Pseudomonas peradeniyensis]MCU7238886.1 hypothetical protein [Pseudomonas peradeniyensis]